MGVPFVDLRAQYRAIQGEIDEAIRHVIESTSFVLGPAVERFESDFARYLGVDHVVATNNGTTALQLALLALEIRAGDEVIVPAHTFIATAEAVAHVGATPVFVDVREDTGNLDPTRLADAATSRTRAIIPVHL
ncbi:MAG TPA: aminotransferase class I/II-fold pyridoxal phosphate-dependent enzyme, partial [Candidatus Eisenbacteria bacterium]|nr:aminotransferase class I/II-fold pyridoxal phosphate-dependent enzyme [Candidatus Eisenbacteria bacterium]